MDKIVVLHIEIFTGNSCSKIAKVISRSNKKLFIRINSLSKLFIDVNNQVLVAQNYQRKLRHSQQLDLSHQK